MSNVLYRWDAETIEAIMINAESAELHHELSRGSDTTTSQSWRSTSPVAWQTSPHLRELVIGPYERYKVNNHIGRLNDLGFEGTDMQYRPADDGVSNIVRFAVAVGGRQYHSSRLRELTRLDASEHQARQILSDLRHHEAIGAAISATGKSLAAIRWRVDVVEPMIDRLTQDFPDRTPVQRHADFLNHRYLLATEQQRDVSDNEAYDHWLTEGAPGFDPVPGPVSDA